MRRSALLLCLLAVVRLGVSVLPAGEYDPETALRKEEGLPTLRDLVVGRFWSHTPEYYRLAIEANEPKLAAGPISRETSGLVDATAVAYLQLDQYDDALRVLALKESVDPNDYGLNANRSLLHARRALTGPDEAFATEIAAALECGQRALAHSADPLRRDALYLRELRWLAQVHADPTLRERSCLLGYNLAERLAAGLERDKAAKVQRSDPLTVADLAGVLGEDPGFLDAEIALMTVDSLAIPDGLMLLGKASEAMGDLESAYFAYSRLEELGGPYQREAIESRLQALLAKAHGTVALGGGDQIVVPLDRDTRNLLSERCFDRYLTARHEAQLFTESYDRFERQQILKRPEPSPRKILDAFAHQAGAPAAAASEPPTAPAIAADDSPGAEPIDPSAFLYQTAIWVPGALLLAGLILGGVAMLRRYETIGPRA